MEFQIKTQNAEDFIVMKVIGEMDIYTSPNLLSEISKQIESGNNDILLDLSELEYLDSTGLGSLTKCISELQKRGGDLRFLSPTYIFMRLSNLADLSNSFTIYQNIQDARDGWHDTS